MCALNRMFAKNRSTDNENWFDSCTVARTTKHYFFYFRKVHHKDGIVKNNAALQPDNSKTIEDDVSLFLRKAISDIRRIKTRPLKVLGSGYGSGSGEGRNELNCNHQKAF
jgi:hypothetical protein